MSYLESGVYPATVAIDEVDAAVDPNNRQARGCVNKARHGLKRQILSAKSPGLACLLRVNAQLTDYASEASSNEIDEVTHTAATQCPSYHKFRNATDLNQGLQCYSLAIAELKAYVNETSITTAQVQKKVQLLQVAANECIASSVRTVQAGAQATVDATRVCLKLAGAIIIPSNVQAIIDLELSKINTFVTSAKIFTSTALFNVRSSLQAIDSLDYNIEFRINSSLTRTNELISYVGEFLHGTTVQGELDCLETAKAGYNSLLSTAISTTRSCVSQSRNNIDLNVFLDAEVSINALLSNASANAVYRCTREVTSITEHNIQVCMSSFLTQLETDVKAINQLAKAELIACESFSATAQACVDEAVVIAPNKGYDLLDGLSLCLAQEGIVFNFDRH
uniref:Uncharacterized protein n=1 Tax=Clastoptera arizonana TaxID=38151 RepID=A0A1B6DRK3_9HEMI